MCLSAVMLGMSHVFSGAAGWIRWVGCSPTRCPQPSPDDLLLQEHNLEPTVCENSTSDPGTEPVHYPWAFVSSQVMNSMGEEILYRVNDDSDRKWARRLEWVVKQHLDRAEVELDQLQHDFEAVLRQCKDARERKDDQEHIADLNKQLEASHRTIKALLW